MSGAARTVKGHGRLGNTLSSLAVALGCVLFLGGFIWGAVQYQPYTVPTDSMAPTVAAGDRVLAQRIDGDVVRRGDVVVFEDPLWGDLPMVKRVVGVGGDKVACCDKRGLLTVNGEPVKEPYVDGEGPASATGFTATVARGKLFLLGDHRRDSLDSRDRLTDGEQGAVPREAVRARIDATAWPLDGVGMLGRPQAFAGLPGGVSEPGPLRPILLAIGVGAVLVLGGAAYGPIARRGGRGHRR
ncbi:signal peptidase I [Streptomyces gobiensis]|uniref:signal peptidase I n=1 Tax=Streptomyces gobiensis TaxID=2875706 RepID=UPI001E33F5CE|nr:signal peptidase I [Streptomyces gobiensis]UGY93836.1 signal peptidase I [Streptomyces gobiensis]